VKVRFSPVGALPIGYVLWCKTSFLGGELIGRRDKQVFLDSPVYLAVWQRIVVGSAQAVGVGLRHAGGEIEVLFQANSPWRLANPFFSLSAYFCFLVLFSFWK